MQDFFRNPLKKMLVWANKFRGRTRPSSSRRFVVHVSALDALREATEKKTYRQLQLDLGKVLISLVMLSNVLENIY